MIKYVIIIIKIIYNYYSNFKNQLNRIFLRSDSYEVINNFYNPANFLFGIRI